MLTATRKSDNASDTETGETTDLMAEVEEKFGPKFEELTETAKSLAEELASAKDDTDEAKRLTEEHAKVDEEQKQLIAERDAALAKAQLAELRSTSKSLIDTIAAAREPHSDFVLGAGPSKAAASEDPFADESFFVNAKKSFANDRDAHERWESAMAEKAMVQGTGSVGGYLVPPTVSSELLSIREQSNVLRPYFSNVQVDSDTFRIAAQTSGLLAGWVAELAEKPLSELSFGEISVNTFWKAGLAIVSNQLLRNSNPSVDSLIYSDLGKRLAALEEIAFINGSGTGQPLGILQTPGVQFSGDNESGGATTLTSTDPDDLLDEIIDGITAIYTEYFGGPNLIVMHPRTWARIVKNRNTDGSYTVGPPAGGAGGTQRGPTDSIPGYGSGPNPMGTLFGLPVVTTRNVPTNAGAADNESRVIVGNFSEGLILDHASIALDASEHVYFSTNQTVFRAEDAVGFTAARYPKAFYVIGGVGLANG